MFNTFPIIVALGVVAVLAALYLIWPQIAVWRDRVREPACARCRYPSRGISTLTCPECGCDLREVGIVTPGMTIRRRRGPLVAAGVWTLGWAVAGMGICVLMSLFLPGMNVSNKRVPLTSASSLGLTIVTTTHAQSWREDWPEHRVIELSLAHPGVPGAAGDLTLQWPAAVVLSARGSAAPILKPGATADGPALAAWLNAAGASTPEVLGPDLAAAIAFLATESPNLAGGGKSHGSFNTGGSAVSVMVTTPWWAQALVATGWLAPWLLVGLWLIARARRASAAAAPLPRSPSLTP